MNDFTKIFNTKVIERVLRSETMTQKNSEQTAWLLTTDLSMIRNSNVKKRNFEKKKKKVKIEINVDFNTITHFLHAKQNLIITSICDGVKSWIDSITHFFKSKFDNGK